MRPEPLEERRKRLAKLLSRKTKALRDGIQLSEAITGDGAAIFRPYVHARLQNTTLAGDPEKPLKGDSRSELDEARHLAFILSRAMKAKAE